MNSITDNQNADPKPATVFRKYQEGLYNSRDAMYQTIISFAPGIIDISEREIFEISDYLNDPHLLSSLSDGVVDIQSENLDLSISSFEELRERGNRVELKCLSKMASEFSIFLKNCDEENNCLARMWFFHLLNEVGSIDKYSKLCCPNRSVEEEDLYNFGINFAPPKYFVAQGETVVSEEKEVLVSLLRAVVYGVVANRIFRKRLFQDRISKPLDWY